jgi:NAD(P)-dependent dehydrogenase (short-subunit alcohol dehydrogenase family)
MEFQNKTAIITGGASGIGFLSAKCLAEQGANVLLVDINGERVRIYARRGRNFDGTANDSNGDVRTYGAYVRHYGNALRRGVNGLFMRGVNRRFRGGVVARFRL